MDHNFASPRARRGATLGRRPSAAPLAPNAPLGPCGPCRRPSAPMPLATRPATSPRPRYGAVSGRYGPTRGRSPSTARRGGGGSHREPTPRRVATAKRACRAATDAVKTRRAEMRVSGSSVEFTKLLPISVKFRKFGIDDRSYRDYMKLAEFGKLANFTRTFANLSKAKFSESSR